MALATVADLMPLSGENRRLVRDGLAALARDRQAGPARADGRRRASTPARSMPGTLGFRLAPRINAAGRLRRADAGLELLLTRRRRAAEIAAELDAVNGERRAVEQRIPWEAEAQVAELEAAPRVRARRRGLAPRRGRDRRLADRRAALTGPRS